MPADTRRGVLLGGAYSMQKDAHVRMDLFYGRLPPRGRAVLDTITIVCVIFFMVALLWGAGCLLGPLSTGAASQWVSGHALPILMALGAAFRGMCRASGARDGRGRDQLRHVRSRQSRRSR